MVGGKSRGAPWSPRVLGVRGAGDLLLSGTAREVYTAAFTEVSAVQQSPSGTGGSLGHHFPDPLLPSPESSAEARDAENWGLTPRWSPPLAILGGQQSDSFMPPGALG